MPSIPPNSHLGRALSARQWCQSLQEDPKLTRLQEARLDRFDAQLSYQWWPRYLAGKPSTPYKLSNQKPKHYLPFLKASPWWCDTDYVSAIKEQLEAHSSTILEEFRELSDYCRPYPTVPGRTTGTGWSSLWLYHGHFYQKMAQRCPKTLELAQSLNHCGDSLGGVFFSVLKSHTKINPHYGPTNARLRLHLGLDVPEGCWIEVAGQRSNWESGKCLVFDDSFIHQTENESDSDRVILIIDLWHPELTPEELQALKAGWASWGPIADAARNA